MPTTSIIFISIIVVIAVLVATYFHYNNAEVALRKEANAQKGAIETVRDRMFQVLLEQAGVAANYRDAFEKIYPEIIAGRYSRGGELMKWIQESNPTFDTSLYRTLMNSIEVQRTSFTSAQVRMLDIINHREALIESYPSRWFVRDKSQINYPPISTSDTKRVMQTGVDDWTLTM